MSKTIKLLYASDPGGAQRRSVPREEVLVIGSHWGSYSRAMVLGHRSESYKTGVPLQLKKQMYGGGVKMAV